MNKSMRRRSLAALLTTVGCLLLLATPSPATTLTQAYEVTAGTLDVSIDSDPNYEIIIDVSGEDHTCTTDPPPVATITVHDNTTTGMVDITHISLGEPKQDGYSASFFTFNSNEYQLETRLGNPGELGFGTNTGTISGTHPNQTLVQHILLEGLIFETDDCEKTGGPICHFVIELTVSGDINTTLETVGPLDGTGQPLIDFCNSPFAGLADGVADITGLTLHTEA